MAVTLRLFGPFQLLNDDIPLPAGERRLHGEQLLALLALRGQQTRLSLASTLWPDSPEERALFYLRRALVPLRKRLGDEVVCLTEPAYPPGTLKLALPSTACDLWEFETAIRRGDDLTAVSLYQGPLLEGWSEDWVLQTRAQHQQQMLSALERLALQAPSVEVAIAQLERLVTLDPARESAWRPLMQALAERGDPAAVVQVYRKLRIWLQRELQVAPSPETIAHYQKLLKEARSRSSNLALPPPTPPSAARPTNLPVPPTPLVGRTQTLQELHAAREGTRLLTLVGIGGVGKTRLAIALLEELQRRQQFRDGIVWMDLAVLNDPALLAPRIAAALGLSESVNLVDALRERALLLALDNCEHLLEAIARLAEELLSQCPQLHLLATSREALGLSREVIRRVPPLAKDDSIELFCARAQRVLPDWLLTEANREQVGQLCHKLDDLPFAIELAAARLDMLSLEELHQRLDARFDLLTGGSRSALRKQQTLRAAMDWSWNLLTPEERDCLRQLSIFSSSFTLSLSEVVCPRSLKHLPSLVAKSLVSFSPESRCYHLLETVREYTLEQDLGEPGREARQRFLDYALKLTEELAQHRAGPKRPQAHDTLEALHDNLRPLLVLAPESERVTEKTLRLAGSLWTFWMERGHRKEGLRTLRQLLEHAAGLPPAARIQALLGAGALAYETGDSSDAQHRLTESIALARELGDAVAEADALRILGLVCWNQGSPDEARAHYERALALFSQQGDEAGEAAIYAVLGHFTWNLGQLEQAMQYTLQSRQLYQQLEDEAGVAESNASLGLIARSQANYPLARECMEEALAARRRLNLTGGIGAMMHHLGVVSYLEQDFADACTRLHDSARHWREIGDPGWEALSLYYLGLAQKGQGLLSDATRSLTSALLTRRRQGAKRSIAAIQHALGLIWLQQNRLNEAQLALKESALLRLEIGLDSFCGESVDALACLFARRDDLKRSAQLLACAERLREREGELEPLHPQRDEARARIAALPDALRDEALALGNTLPPAMQLSAL